VDVVWRRWVTDGSVAIAAVLFVGSGFVAEVDSQLSAHYFVVVQVADG
jgi:hypothetical protein